MTLEYSKIMQVIEESSDPSNWRKHLNVPDTTLTFTMNDRPVERLNKGGASMFFPNYRDRCLALPEQLGVDFEDELKNLLSFINGKGDELTIYHYSLYPIKTKFDFLQFGQFSATQLDNAAFERFVNANMKAFNHIKIPIPPDRMAQQSDNFPAGYRLLVASKTTAHRVAAHDRHRFFDRLDNIYTNHGILIHLMQHFAEQPYVQSGSISTDNFPNASCSWASTIRTQELDEVRSEDLPKIEKLMDALQSHMFFRLLLRAEIKNTDVFARLIFLRSILDLFFTKRERAIDGLAKKVGKKTVAQAIYVLKTMESHDAKYTDTLTQDELVRFLSVRNDFVHPTPKDDVSKLHILFDKEHLFRKLVYEFFVSSWLKNIDNDTDLFSVDTKL